MGALRRVAANKALSGATPRRAMAERSFTERERPADEKGDMEAPAQEQEEEGQEPPAEQVPPPAVVTKVEAKSELMIDSDTCLKLSHALDLSTWYAKGVIRRQGGADPR